MAELTEALLLIKVSRNTLYLGFLSHKINSLCTFFFSWFVFNIMLTLFPCQKRKSQENRDLDLMVEASSSQESSVRELQAAHAETIQELEKMRNLLNMESQISKDYKVKEDTDSPANMSKCILFTFSFNTEQLIQHQNETSAVRCCFLLPPQNIPCFVSCVF